ncbi:ABC transporter substrate-binding protein [Candidatus Aerophobetes bacterium Ae_b3b]|nr:MAG: ABC transporter substrate-binding protein [Candidatus Aerophobetes bacterium Ae_b3b]
MCQSTSVRIGFTSPEPESSDVYRIPMQFMQKAAEDAKRAGLEVFVSSEPSPKRDWEYQVQVIEEFVGSGIDALIVHPADVKPIKPALEKAIEAGVCVVLVNLLQTAEYADLDITSYIGFDNYIAGQISAYATVDYLGGPGCLGSNKTESPPVDSYLGIDWYKSLYLSKNNIEVAGNVIIIEGVPGSFTSTERLKGFRNVVDKFPNIVIKGIYPGYWNPQKASGITEKILNEYKEDEVDVIWAACNDMAFGVIDILEQNGRLNQERHPDAQGMAVITNDGTPKSLKMIEQGRLVAETWHGFPEWGWHGVEFATKTAQGQSVPVSHDIVPRIEFSGNITQFFPYPKLPEIHWKG